MPKITIEVDAEMIPELYAAMDARVRELREFERIAAGRFKRDLRDLALKVDRVAGMLLEKRVQLIAEGILPPDE
jgi:hypothetical protein